MINLYYSDAYWGHSQTMNGPQKVVKNLLMSFDEKELGDQPIIGSVSFGATRKFRLRNKNNKKMIHNIELENGSLLIMSKLTQQYWEHEKPKTKKKVAERINLTFRTIL